MKRPLFCYDQHIGEWRVNPCWGCKGGGDIDPEPEPEPGPGPEDTRIFDDTFDMTFE